MVISMDNVYTCMHVYVYRKITWGYGGLNENLAPKAQMFKCFVPSKWNFLRTIRRCGPVGVGVSSRRCLIWDGL